MNQKTLIGLAVAALVAIVAAIAMNRAGQPRSDEGGGEARYLVPELRDHVNDVDKLTVTGAGDKVVATITRGASGWSIAEKDGYAADTGKLREFLLKLADATLLEQKTASKDKYAALGVEDVSAADAKGLKVDIGGLKQPVALIVGTSNARGGTFVRRAGDAQSWLASASLKVDKKAEDWLRKDLVDIAANRIASIEIVRDGKTIRVAKDAEGDANFKLADVPKGRQAGSEFTLNGLGSTLAGLRFDDVVPGKDAPVGDKALKARYATFDGVLVDVVAWEKDGKDYAQLAASLDRDRAGRHIDAEQAKPKADDAAAGKDDAADATADSTTKPDAKAKSAAADPARDREQKMAALDKEVADLSARFKDRTFVLPAYKYANINKSEEDLLKPIEGKKDDTHKAPSKAAAKPVGKTG